MADYPLVNGDKVSTKRFRFGKKFSDKDGGIAASSICETEFHCACVQFSKTKSKSGSILQQPMSAGSYRRY